MVEVHGRFRLYEGINTGYPAYWVIDDIHLLDASSEACTYYVDATCGNDTNEGSEAGPWRTIQHAVDTAVSQDAIIVQSGVYNENVVIDNPHINLMADGDVTVVALAQNSPVFRITADYVDIIGFTVKNATSSYGMYLYHADHCRISDNTMVNNRDGISIYYSCSNTLTNNTANSNDYYGIHLCYSSNNTLTYNNASNNRYGTYIEDSSNYNILESDTVNSNSWYGIYLSSSSNNTLKNSTANSNDYGIYMWSSSNGDITHNRVQNNTERGVYVSGGSTDNSISYNNIIENGNYNATSGGWEWQFYNGRSHPVEVKHNYWGAGMNNDAIDASIYDDEEGTGKVEFYPFETEPTLYIPTPEPHTFTPADAAIALEIAAGSRPFDAAADVSGDGQVTSLDALMILQAAAGSIEL
jgi:parallel beta-helix repeat protein